jgi:hypothetical protein
MSVAAKGAFFWRPLCNSVTAWIVRAAVLAIAYAVTIAINAIGNAIAVAAVLVLATRRLGNDTPGHHSANDNQQRGELFHWFS